VPAIGRTRPHNLRFRASSSEIRKARTRRGLFHTFCLQDGVTCFVVSEPPRLSRRLVSLSQAAMADPSNCS
jgi:hypothetical protein